MLHPVSWQEAGEDRIWAELRGGYQRERPGPGAWGPASQGVQRNSCKPGFPTPSPTYPVAFSVLERLDIFEQSMSSKFSESQSRVAP